MRRSTLKFVQYGLGLAAAGLAAVVAASAVAQPVLEEIVVTARKQEERLQDIPITVTALTNSLITQHDIKDPYDLSRLVPGFNYQNNAGRRTNARLLMRGLTTATVGSAKASAFIDGIYVFGDFSFLDFANVERIEIMPGPQSTQFGRSTFAGAFNFITRLPTDEFQARAAGALATRGTSELSLRVSGPLIEGKLLGQLTGWHNKVTGPDAWANSPDGHRIGATQSQSSTATLVLNAAEDVRVIGRASYNDDDDGIGVSYLINPAERNGRFVKPNGVVAFYPVGRLRPPSFGVKGSPMTFNLEPYADPGLRRQQWRTNLELDATVGMHDIKLVGAHNYEHEWNRIDGDFTFFPGSNSSTNNVRKDDSLELRINAPQDQRLRYAVGAYYLKTTLDANALQILRNTVNAAGVTVPSGIMTRTSAVTTTRDESVFGGLYFDLIENLTLSAEARYQSEKITSRNRVTGVVLQDTFNSFLPRLNVDYKIDDTVMIYAVYSKGNNPGTFNTSPFIGTPGSGTSLDMIKVDEEIVYNYEAGIKSTWLDGRLLFNLAAFHLDWAKQTATRNFQAPTGQLFSVIQNIGSSDIDGFELESQAIVVEGFDVRVTASYYHTAYGDNVCSPNLAALFGRSDLPAPNNCLFVGGNHFEGLSPWQISLSAGYEAPVVGEWKGFIRGELSHMSKQYDSEMNLNWTEPAEVINARVGVERDDFSFEIYGRNITNEDAYTRIGRFSDARLGTSTQTNQNVAIVLRMPSQFGARFTWQY